LTLRDDEDCGLPALPCRPMMRTTHDPCKPGATHDSSCDPADRPSLPWYRILYVQVLIAIALGVLIGYFYPALGKQLKPLGDGFIALIKMMIAPVIFCTVVHGISSMGDLKRVGRVGLKALIYFETVSTVALAVGLLVGRTLQPGRGFNIDPATIDPSSVATYVTKAKEEGIVAHLMGIIPDSYFDALARGFITLAATLSIVLTFRSSRSRYWSASTSS
jgi:aerobic C4-dicarboxylate transport protein